MTDINNGLKEKEIYKHAMFLVIDDPITSFDQENRVGVLSFLKSQLLLMFRGNIQSRLILLSHDLCTIFDLEKVCNELLSSININIASNDRYQIKLSELSKWSLQKNSFRGNEYSGLLQMIFDFASDKHDDYDSFIGNVIRRIFEAFATFEYRKGVNEISCDPTILKSLENDKYETYFENLMCRIVINTESHTLDNMRSLNNICFFNTITIAEKKRTARDIICFMHLLNPDHVAAHFFGNQKMISKIISWEKNILNLS
jgi:wobble nucleotide-excising tRNase